MMKNVGYDKGNFNSVSKIYNDAVLQIKASSGISA
jgi:hypothetical protein